MSAAAPALLPPRDRRHVGIAVTVLVHALLILGWQATRRASTVEPEPRRSTVQWIRLPAPVVPAPRHEEEHIKPIQPHLVPLPGAITLVPPAPPAASAPAASTDPAMDALASPAPSAPSAATLLERARRDVGAVDRVLRKENKAYIVAPPDSPQIRLRKGIQAAADMAPNAWYEAPKTEELVNNTGDGARRTRVGSGDSSYCITERSPATSIDMIEKHGKVRITNCPAHESTANAQEWRTARD
jgi:hypothetical protein